MPKNGGEDVFLEQGDIQFFQSGRWWRQNDGPKMQTCASGPPMNRPRFMFFGLAARFLPELMMNTAIEFFPSSVPGREPVEILQHSIVRQDLHLIHCGKITVRKVSAL